MAIDEIVAGSESELHKMARLIQEIYAQRCSVLIGMTPEHEILAETIKCATVYWSCDLKTPMPEDAISIELYKHFVHGIPYLEDAVGRLQTADLKSVISDPSYMEQFLVVLEKSLRPELMKEELYMRTCMVLLGVGTFEDVERVLGKLDGSLWRDIARDAPFFGVDVAHNRFSCVGETRADVLNVSYRVIKEAAKDRPELIIRSARYLAMRGDIVRSAVVSGICDVREARMELGLELSVLYLNAGATNVTKDALDTARTQKSAGLRGFYVTECLHQVLEDKKPTDLVGMLKNLDGESLQMRQACLAIACRGVWRGTVFLLGEGAGKEFKPFVEMCVREAKDDVSSPLASHVKVLTFLAQGSLKDAYSLLLAVKGCLSGTCVSQALIAMDYVFCSLALGNAPTHSNMAALEEAHAFLSASGFKRLSALCELVVPVGRVLGGRASDENAIDVALSRADRMDERFLHAALLLVSGVSDMRQGGYTRAHVRFEQAEESFAAMGLKALEAEAYVLDIAVRIVLDERVPASEINACKGFSQSLDQVIAVMLLATSKSKQSLSSWDGVYGNEYYLGNVFWLMNVLINDCGALSNRIRDIVPDLWRSSIVRGIASVERLFTGQVFPQLSVEGASELMPALKKAGVAKETDIESKVYVSVLGGLNLQVKGIPIPPERIARRNAAHLLSLLGSVRDHALERYKIIESLWPGHDMERGCNCIYAAMNVLRTEVKAVIDDPNGHNITLLTSSAAEGIVSLNEYEVICDVDIFEEMVCVIAHREEDAGEVVSLCKEVDAMYRGDLYVPTVDYAAVVNDRMLELRGYFVDAMVMGSGAALKLGSNALAYRFAQRAMEAGSDREDAIEVLVTSLRAVGRGLEAFDEYDEFVVRLRKKSNCLPSRSLRALMERLRAEESMRYIRHKPRKVSVQFEAIRVVSVSSIDG
ncbi:MAG: bacterial transcriptional activator domain-containing protein [Coriobacteriales bacterium]|nr:bacterial transcriptional activator domain-containing protein [Coriobacteriales bacterium]